MKSDRSEIYTTNLCQEIVLTDPVLCQIYEIKFGFAERTNKRNKVNQYNFSRSNWYQAEFDDRHYFEVDAWCEQHFGRHPSNPDAWSRWWHKFHNSILFRDEKDYVLFMLRWS